MFISVCAYLFLIFFLFFSGGDSMDYPVRSVNRIESDSNVKAENLREIASLMLRQTLPLFRAPLLKYTLLVCLVQFGIFAT